MTVGTDLEFDSDDNVPSGLLRWMRRQKTTPKCVTMGSNATYCAIGTSDDGGVEYELSANFHQDRDLVSFLNTAKVNQELAGVRVTFSNVSAAGNGNLPYYIVSIGNRVCLWNVHETADKVLRSRAYADLRSDVKVLNNRLKLAAVKADVDKSIQDLQALVDAAVTQEDVIDSLAGMHYPLGSKATHEYIESLEVRIAKLEARAMGIPTTEPGTPTKSDTPERPETPKQPEVIPPVVDTDWSNTSTLAMTYSRYEYWRNLANDLSDRPGDIKANSLEDYNKQHKDKMDSDTQRFWSGSDRVEKAVVFIPWTADEITARKRLRPQRIFHTKGPPFNLGSVIAAYFGVEPGNIKVTDGTIDGTREEWKTAVWNTVLPTETYDNHTMKIPAVEWKG